MQKLAIDVVLIPSGDILDLCLEINKRSFLHNKGRFHMSTEDFVPHISLLLGCVTNDKIPIIIDGLKSILRDVRPIKITAEGIMLVQKNDGNRGMFSVKVSDDLRILHEKVAGEFKQYLIKCNSPEVFYGGKKDISDISKSNLNSFIESAAYENFRPHINLGSFDSDKYSEDIQFPISSTSDEVALFHVGDGCTCREKLCSFKLV